MAHGGAATGRSIDDVVARMTALQRLVAGGPRTYFLAVYRRTTIAVAERIERGFFLDGPWVERWDVVFADLYLDALDAPRPPAPWRAAFGAAGTAPPLRHVLLGMNAHINYDLPLALLGVISDEDAADADLMARRRVDHTRVDQVLADRVGAEDDELAATGRRTLTDRLLAPLNRRATRRLLAESRRKVWTNTLDLLDARRRGPAELDAQLRRLEQLAAQRVLDLHRPGSVLIRLARNGFGVLLRPAEPMRSFDPVVLGTAERDAWATYYRHEWPAFTGASWRLAREVFSVSPGRTALLAWWVLRANQVWAPFPDNDPDAARAVMRKVFALVARVHGLDLDPDEAAAREIAWWDAHRTAQHDPSTGRQALVGALTRSFAYLYDVGPERVRPAAVLRAEAMERSDAWVAAGRRPDDPALDDVADLLVRSYAHLLAAVRTPLPDR